ncbi:type II RES/Xre toxin-antitoxin system antitoxin [Trinickia symbiotica]|uniref:type II RES/Xre toxin-antitoxin system antitoxin n=1 Tax=Trinickia symbiotica TaxID=863227 RepID=UPI00215975D9|nr:antitoxin Xre-like helix-turn-helix domain-containing protein [Trinickia symbiotica]
MLTSVKSSHRRKALEPEATGSLLEEFYLHGDKPKRGHVLPSANLIAAVYAIEPQTRIHIIKKGVSPKIFLILAKSMAYTKEELAETLGLSTTTIDRKAKSGESLSPDQSERIVAMAKLIGQVQAIVEQSGDATDFDAAKWVARWLEEPLPALGGQRPAELMDTAEGREVVSNLLAMTQSGAYA